jgi:hypothetical protein
MASNYLTSTAASSTSWATAANWSGLAVPVSTDTTTVDQSAAQIDTGLGQQAVTLTKLTIPLTFTGTVGLAATSNTAKSVSSITRSSSTATVTTATAHGYATGDSVVISGAVESDYNGTYSITSTGTTTFTYTVANTPSTPATGTIICRRHHALCIGATTFRYGDPGTGATAAAGSGRISVDFGSVQTAATIVSTKTSGTDSNLEPVRLLGSHASNTLTVNGGLVGVATTTPTETATLATINVTGGTLNGGPGLTWTDINQTGGTINLNCGASGSSDVNQSAGTCTINGAGTIVNITVAGTMKLNVRKASAGDTITGTLQVLDGGVLDFSGNPANISITTLRVTGEVTIRRNQANPGHVSWTTLTQDPGSSIKFE